MYVPWLVYSFAHDSEFCWLQRFSMHGIMSASKIFLLRSETNVTNLLIFYYRIIAALLRSVHTVRQRLRQRCCYQLDSTVSNGLVHTGAAGAAVPQGAASKWVPTLFYAAVYAAAAAAKTLAAPLPHRVNEPLDTNFLLRVALRIFRLGTLINWQLQIKWEK